MNVNRSTWSCMHCGIAVLPMLTLVLVTTRSLAQQPNSKVTTSASDAQVANSDPPLVPLPRAAPSPPDNPTTAAKVALGKQLFFDPRLSGDNTMSCATCHVPEKAFGDAMAFGKGHQGKVLRRNTQTCLNVGFYTTFFWDGRAATLEEQALGPIQSADEMNQDLRELEHELTAIPGYADQFRAVFGSTPTADAIAKALAAYQRTLITGLSPFDRFLMGDKDALSDEAKQGLELFRNEAGCIECHRGPLLSDNKFYRLRLTRDPGRAEVTGDDDDRHRFRTPSLRNVAETAPYMHDGSLKTLDDVVTFYYREIPSTGPNGLLPDADALTGQSYDEIPLIVAFLKSLTGEVAQVTPPRLPSSGKSRLKSPALE